MITFGTQNLRPGTDIVDAGLDKEILFGLGFTPDEASINATPMAFLWTNLDSDAPHIFREVAMEPVKPSDDHRYAFAVTLSLTTPGTYTATAFVRHGSEEEIWVGKDVNWRVSVPGTGGRFAVCSPNITFSSRSSLQMDQVLQGANFAC
uniref:Uncharacterized protein n=1 Tax=Candidatus Kentrum sp. SD TaxID=2126332 RepID=A0A450YPU4_9GAMM|nr:MAG: hypothetical protein BECKSD772F_GA0070984_11511 [Candidatus Kentron sp. SD]VFK48711.1 MAG: hypothetical protein BECKSD772E_GA0070983_11378 [Candidatus Kentron sp. SD]